jgi:SAM-dependent methyltransferase
MSTRSASVKAFFEEADRYLDHNHHIPVRAEAVRALLGDIRGKRIVDLGAGDGGVSRPLLDEAESITLVDVSSAMLARAKARTPEHLLSRARFVEESLDTFEDPEPFDAVMCIGVLAHVDSVPRALEKIARLLKPGGRAVIELTDRDKVLSRVQALGYAISSRARGGAGYTVNRTTIPMVKAAAAAAGLRYDRALRHSLTLPGMGRLPLTWLVAYDLFALEHQAIGRFGTAAILAFDKPR